MTGSKDLRDPGLPLYASRRCQLILQGTVRDYTHIIAVAATLWGPIARKMHDFPASDTVTTRPLRRLFPSTP